MVLGQMLNYCDSSDDPSDPIIAQGRPYTLKLAVGKHDRPSSIHHMLLSYAFKSSTHQLNIPVYKEK
jgi:hypothetical protein